VPLATYPVARWSPVSSHLTHVVGAVRQLRQIADRHIYDAALFGSYDVALAGSWVLRKWPVPNIFLYHSAFYHDWLRGPRGFARVRQRVVSSYTDSVQKRVFRWADRIVAVSEFSKEEILTRAPEAAGKVVSISTGVDTAIFQPAASRAEVKQSLGYASQDPVVIGVGRLVPVKRWDLWLQVLARLRQQGTAVRGVLVGAGPQEASLRAQVDRLGLGTVVRFAGFCDAQQVRTWLQAADLMLSTSYFENRSLATLEALACGVPVVCPAQGGTAATMQLVERELVCEQDGAAALADRVERWLRQPESLDALRSRCRAVAVEQFDWERVVDQLERLCQSVKEVRVP